MNAYLENPPNINLNYVMNQEQLATTHHFIDKLLEHHAKLLAVRVDFYLPPSLSSPELLSDLFTKFRNNIRHNSLFNALVGYIKKLEYGTERGWHLHVLFFFNGHIEKHDYRLGRDIGEYWKTVITNQRGHFHSSNMNPANYFKCDGLGMVYYTDQEKIANLKYVASYLCKQDTLPLTENNRLRTFSTSQFSTTSTRGRPRLYQ